MCRQRQRCLAVGARLSEHVEEWKESLNMLANQLRQGRVQIDEVERVSQVLDRQTTLLEWLSWNASSTHAVLFDIHRRIPVRR